MILSYAPLSPPIEHIPHIRSCTNCTGDWLLPDWTDLNGAEAVLLRLLVKAGSPKALLGQLCSSIGRVKDLQRQIGSSSAGAAIGLEEGSRRLQMQQVSLITSMLKGFDKDYWQLQVR